MESIAYYNGQVGSPDELTVPFNDRSHFFGDGIYEAAIGANGVIYALEDHLDRFYTSAVLFDIHIPLSRNELGDLLLELLSQVDGDMNLVYWQVTRGEAPREHTYDDTMAGRLWVMIRPEGLVDPLIPLKLITLEDRRFGYGNVKTLNLMPAVKYSQDALHAGVDEAVLHRDGVVTECAHSNIHILKNGILYTHPNDEYILRGIAKTRMVNLCYRESIPVVERAFTIDEMMDADEILVTSSGNLLTFASEVNGQSVGGKDPRTLARLRNAVYQDFMNYTGLTKLF